MNHRIEVNRRIESSRRGPQYAICGFSNMLFIVVYLSVYIYIYIYMYIYVSCIAVYIKYFIVRVSYFYIIPDLIQFDSIRRFHSIRQRHACRNAARVPTRRDN